MSVIERLVWSLVPFPAIRRVVLQSAGGLLWYLLATRSPFIAVEGMWAALVLIAGAASVAMFRRRLRLDVPRRIRPAARVGRR